jgi:O-antigen/teichoic acid export membrane protein
MPGLAVSAAREYKGTTSAMSVRFVFGSSIVYLMVLLAERVASVLLTPLLTRLLSPADYSAILLVANGSALINLLFGFSFVQSLTPMFSNAETPDDRRSASTTVLLMVSVLMALTHAGVILLSRSISLYFLHTDIYSTAIALGAVWSFLSGCSICLVAIARMTERHKLYLYVQLPALIVQVGLIVWLLVFVMAGINGMYIAMSAAAAMTATTYVMVLRHWLTGQFDAAHLRKAFAIGMQLLPWQFSMVLTTNSAAFFLTRSGHIVEAGLFSVANGLAVLVMVASNSFESVWTPYVLLRKDDGNLPAIQLRVFSLYSSTLLVGTAVISLFAYEIFVVLVGPAFREGYGFVPPLAFAYCIYGFGNCFAQGLAARMRIGHYVWIGLAAAAVFVSVCLPLVGQWGAHAVILAMGCGFLSMLIMLQVITQRLAPVPYPWARHGLMWLIAAGLVGVTYPVALGWQGGAVKLAVLVAIVALPFVFGAIRWSDVLLAKGLILAPSR